MKPKVHRGHGYRLRTMRKEFEAKLRQHLNPLYTAILFNEYQHQWKSYVAMVHQQYPETKLSYGAWRGTVKSLVYYNQLPPLHCAMLKILL